MTRQTRQLLLFIAVVVIAAGLLTASGGVSIVDADRPMQVAVTTDESAALGLVWHSLDRCGSQQLVELKNRFGETLTDIDVDVVRSDRLAVAIQDTPSQLGPGASGTVHIKLTPLQANKTDTRSVTLRLQVLGPTVHTTIAARQRPVTNCPTRSSQSHHTSN